MGWKMHEQIKAGNRFVSLSLYMRCCIPAYVDMYMHICMFIHTYMHINFQCSVLYVIRCDISEAMPMSWSSWFLSRVSSGIRMVLVVLSMSLDPVGLGSLFPCVAASFANMHLNACRL